MCHRVLIRDFQNHCTAMYCRQGVTEALDDCLSVSCWLGLTRTNRNDLEGCKHSLYKVGKPIRTFDETG